LNILWMQIESRIAAKPKEAALYS
jgi:hypothetical protein